MSSCLWYQKPAEKFSEALPFGNGSFGGMVYGGVPKEVITLNQDTLWSGTATDKEIVLPKEGLEKAREYIKNSDFVKADEWIKMHMLGTFTESYMPMGILEYKYENVKCYKNYRRTLDLDNAVISTEFVSATNRINTELFASYPAGMAVLSIRAQNKKSLSVRFSLNSLLHCKIEAMESGLRLKGCAPSHVEPNYVETENPVIYDMENPGILFELMVKIKETDGIVESDGTDLVICKATKIEVMVVAENGYSGFLRPLQRNRSRIKNKCLCKLEKGKLCTYEELKEQHKKDYGNIFNKLKFTLGGKNNDCLPTDLRLRNFQNGNEDLGIYPLYLQYARYLMICSSRAGSQPANLQGIWNEELRPAWSSNYTLNINTEMNYWLIGPGNLEECQQPFDQMMKELSECGKQTAWGRYHCRGWTAHHNTDLWRKTDPVGGLPTYAFWPMGGVWMTEQMYENNKFFCDQKHLREKVYPVMEGCVQFVLDWLVLQEDGFLHSLPSTTPENVFYDEQGRVCSVSDSTAMDICLIKELFSDYLELTTFLEVENAVVHSVRQALEKVPMPIVSEEGVLLEWNRPFKEVDAGHRHFSPVYGIFPGSLYFRKGNEKYIEASRKLIERRTENSSHHIGWSCAWLIHLYAWLKQPEFAYQYLQSLIANSTYPNFFDLHPPLGEGFSGEKEVFQIDGNFGGASGILALLLQSRNERVELLPALPNEWKEGHICGIGVQGGIEAELCWKKHTLVYAILYAKKSCKILLHYKYQLRYEKEGKLQEISYMDEQGQLFEMKAGKKYKFIPQL